MAQVGVLAISASQAGIGCFKQFVLVLTQKSSWPQVWGSKDNEGKMKLKNMHLHRGCKVPGETLKKCGSRGEITPLSTAKKIILVNITAAQTPET